MPCPPIFSPRGPAGTGGAREGGQLRGVLPRRRQAVPDLRLRRPVPPDSRGGRGGCIQTRGCPRIQAMSIEPPIARLFTKASQRGPLFGIFPFVVPARFAGPRAVSAPRHHVMPPGAQRGGGGVSSAAASPRTARVWDYQTKCCIQTLAAHNHNISCVMFHPDVWSPARAYGGGVGTRCSVREATGRGWR